MLIRIFPIVIVFVFPLLCAAQDQGGALPFGQAVADPFNQSGLTVELKRFAEMPATSDSSPRTRINDMASLADGRLFVNDLRGMLYEVSTGAAKLYMDFESLVPALHHETGLGSGLGSVAFHPDFGSNGKFYTGHVEQLDPSEVEGATSSFISRGWSVAVISEWTTDDPTSDRFEGTSRELLRINFPTDVHGLQDLAFNPNSRAGEPDYGMLYLCVGEGGSMQVGRTEDLRNLSSLLGCILRIDPMGTGGSKGDYGIPPDNPWANHDDPNVLGEIWCMGMRNPHRLSWDTDGTGRMLFGDIGEMRVEEINIGEPGRDYGWPIREGVYRFDSATRHLVYNLEEEERRNEPDLTYPVAQYDHTQGYAISGGGVYRGKKLPELYGKYVFGDIVSGRLFYVDESQLEFGSLAPVSEFNISIDGVVTSLARLIGGGRVDLRLGWDVEGELYVFEKGLGIIYKAESSKLSDEAKELALQSIDRQLIQHTLKVDPAHAIVASGKNGLIDDLEDGDLNLLPIEGRYGSWTALNFASGGSDSLTIVESKDSPGRGSHVLQISGERVGRESPTVLFSLVGELAAGNSVHYDASVYEGIQFWVKGSQGGRMSFKINTAYTVPVSDGGLCDADGYECWNDYECRASVEEDWTLVRLPFARFLQSGLPNDGPLDSSILKMIGFSLRARPGAIFWLDDISFYGDK